MAVILLTFSCSKENSIDNDGSQSPDTDNTTDKTVDEASRSAAVQLYEDYYVSSSASASDVSWTGSEPDCQPGEVPQETMDKIFMRLLYFRKAAGLHNNIAENSSKSEKAQRAALMMHANGTLDHDPPTDWKCYSQAGDEGAGNSLLASTRNADAIDTYIRDRGNENYPVGHRRWLLWPKLQEIGVGNTSSYNAIWVLGNSGEPPSDAPEFIAWPPPGYLPKQLAYARWSFSIAKADFERTEITMTTDTGENIAMETEELTGIYGDNTIVWKPEINISTLSEDTTFMVQVNNVGIAGEMRDFAYKTVLFDSTK